MPVHTATERASPGKHLTRRPAPIAQMTNQQTAHDMAEDGQSIGSIHQPRGPVDSCTDAPAAGLSRHAPAMFSPARVTSHTSGATLSSSSSASASA
ncbi:hypothetical protein DL769_007862 [Monosporascus sp. CRB-8-3]|nr:hypothetical protein DL769_007862 [Monosporascus sp. CRB-8-3]